MCHLGRAALTQPLPWELCADETKACLYSACGAPVGDPWKDLRSLKHHCIFNALKTHLEYRSYIFLKMILFSSPPLPFLVPSIISSCHVFLFFHIPWKIQAIDGGCTGKKVVPTSISCKASPWLHPPQFHIFLERIPRFFLNPLWKYSI